MAPILPLLLSLLLTQEAAPAEAPAPAATPAEVEYPIPPGAPDDDFHISDPRKAKGPVNRTGFHRPSLSFCLRDSRPSPR